VIYYWYRFRYDITWVTRV